MPLLMKLHIANHKAAFVSIDMELYLALNFSIPVPFRYISNYIFFAFSNSLLFFGDWMLVKKSLYHTRQLST